ncbi:MAG: GldG family protein [Planctomycetes bacterium]|nr:GldG family protein [Planctomycetota bacterium]
MKYKELENKEAVSRTGWTGWKKFLVVLNVMLAIVIAFALLLEVNYLSSRHYMRRDMTFAQEFELADITKNVLKQIPETEKVQLHLLRKLDEAYTENGRQYTNAPVNVALLRLNDIIDELKQYSGSVEFFLYDLNTANAKVVLEELKETIGIVPESCRANDLIIIYKGRKKTVSVNEMFTAENPTDYASQPKLKSFFAESVITSAIRELIEDRKTVIYFMTGHKELDKDSNEDGIGIFASLLLKENCELKKIEKFSTYSEIPPDCDVLVIPSAGKKFQEFEIQTISGYVNNGGRILILLRAMTDTGIEKIAEDLGLKVGNDLVMEGDKSYTQISMGTSGLAMPLPEGQFYVDRFGNHIITEKLAGTALLCQLARSVTPSEKLPDGVEAVPLLMTTEKGWGETDYRHADKARFNSGKDLQGPVTFAVAVTRKAAADNIHNQARLVIVGSHFSIEDAVMNFMPEFTLNSVRWLAEKENEISIPRKNPENRMILFSENDATFLKWLLLLIMPAFIALFGFSLWLIRRR